MSAAVPAGTAVGVSAELLDHLRAAALLQNAVADAVRDSDLTLDRWRCLAQVGQRPGASMSDLTEALVMAPATASRAVDALVDRGFLYRGLDPADRRRVVLRVTGEGRQVLADCEHRLPVVTGR
ncbi:MarR family winged helix-turn-helix transcriptional regulator [Kineococcus sp. SYSU DK002]|uniref:MarR family winged helix-turn-helix transcriptional regulator n=1 Tax=Kineococcus sp. SYSU DK002 TaxID=3383123 RepID=UPI003D7CA776